MILVGLRLLGWGSFLLFQWDGGGAGLRWCGSGKQIVGFVGFWRSGEK